MSTDPQSSERGYLVAGLVAMVAILMIFSLVGFQAWEEVLRRDKEAEMMFRAQEIVRAIVRYRMDHQGVAPIRLDQLLEPGPRGQYYLRHDYKDPLVKDGKWGLLFMSPDGGIFDPTAQNAAVDSSLAAGIVQAENKGAGLAQVPGAGDSGMPLAGVKSLATDKPFRVYHGFSDYSQWLFTYLDLQTGLAGVGGVGGGAGGMPPGGIQPPGTPPPGFGGGSGSGTGGFNRGSGTKGAGRNPGRSGTPRAGGN